MEVRITPQLALLGLECEIRLAARSVDRLSRMAARWARVSPLVGNMTVRTAAVAKELGEFADAVAALTEEHTT